MEFPHDLKPRTLSFNALVKSLPIKSSSYYGGAGGGLAWSASTLLYTLFGFLLLYFLASLEADPKKMAFFCAEIFYIIFILLMTQVWDNFHSPPMVPPPWVNFGNYPTLSS